MLAKFSLAADFAIEGVFMGVNYGFERVRMVAPVHVGRRIRGRFVLKDFQKRTPDQRMVTLGAVVEIEGERRPALVADWLILQFLSTPGSVGPYELSVVR
jgi:acyl dehydratase